MAKKKTKSKNRYQAWLANDYSIGWLLFWFIVALALAFWIFHTYQVHQQGRKFTEAKQELAAVTKFIETRNKPENSTHNEYCRYQSRVIGKGKRYCVLESTLSYADSASTRSSLRATISELTKEQFIKNYRGVSYSPAAGEIISAGFSLTHFKDCGIKVAHLLGESDLTAHLSCTDYALAEYFPVDD